MSTAEKLIQEYQDMPNPEKQKVIDFLSAELDIEGLNEDIRIADERLEEIQNGKEEVIPAGQLFADEEANEL